MPVNEGATIQVFDLSALSPGNDFGSRYRIESILGQGGMGRVYKAYDKTLDRVVAIKVIRQGVMGEDGALQRFKQELLLASKISHKHILRIHDMGEVGPVKFISMAYVEGPDLQHVIRDNPNLPFEKIFRYSHQLADALSAAHGEGVVHRDLKPQNILVDKEDNIYVSDFGLAKSLEDNASTGMTRTGAFIGTPRYMSPEQVEGNPVDQRSDLYSYGLILYEMATGDVPFTGETTLKVMFQRIQEIPVAAKLKNPGLPDWFNGIIMRCLEKDPKDRYQAADEILGDLQSNLGTLSAYVGVTGGTNIAARAASAGISSTLPARFESQSRTIQIQLPSFLHRKSTWLMAGAVALLLIALAIPLLRHLVFPVGTNSNFATYRSGIPPTSRGLFVAVLPLQVLGDPNQLGYLAQGIEEALSTKLFQLKNVHVVPEEQTAKADQKQSLRKIASTLGANLIIQGTVQGAGDKIRVLLKLQDATNDRLVWTQSFDGATGDIFTLEDAMYNPLVSALNINPTNDELAKADARPTENVAAYDLYLRGRNALHSHDQKTVESSLDFFNRALKEDPSFALAYAGIADASLRMFAITSDTLWTQKALRAAQQAEQLDSNLPEVHSVLGAVYNATGKTVEAVAELKRALSLEPNSDDAYRRLGHAYMASGNGPQAIESFQKAVQLNPYFWQNQDALGAAYLELGDYSHALLAFQQVTTLEPEMEIGYENIGNVYVQQGKYQESIPYFQKAIQIEPYYSTYSNLGTAYFFLKQYPNAAHMFEKAVELNPNDTMMAVNLADSYRASNQLDKARDVYQKAISLGYKQLQTNPRDSDTMAQIAIAYAKIGNGAQAEDYIKRARAIDKNNVNYIYTDALILAVLGKTNESLKALQEALKKHYPADYAAAEPDLQILKSNPQFAALLKQYSRK